MSTFADLSWSLNECCNRLAFIQDALSQNAPNSLQSVFEFTAEGQSGLYLILGDIIGKIAESESLAETIISKSGGAQK